MSGRFRALAALALGLLAACAETPEPARPVGLGAFAVMGPAADLDPAAPPPSWATSDAAAFAVAERDGATALEIVPAGDDPVVLGRWLAVRPLARPFLRWGWTAEARAKPVVYLGFRRKYRPRRTLPAPWDERAVPAVARAIEVAWPCDAGPVRVWRDRERRVARLNGTRAGRVVGRWRLETLDLPRVYREIWPDDDLATVELVFVGFGADGAAGGAGYVAEAVLLP